MIRRKDYYFECRCNRKFHIRTRKYIKQFYCPVCGAYCNHLSIIRNPLSRKNKENLKTAKEIMRSNRQILKEMGIER